MFRNLCVGYNGKDTTRAVLHPVSFSERLPLDFVSLYRYVSNVCTYTEARSYEPSVSEERKKNSRRDVSRRRACVSRSVLFAQPSRRVALVYKPDRLDKLIGEQTKRLCCAVVSQRPSLA